MSASHGASRLRRLHSKTKASKHGLSQYISGRSASFQSLQLVLEVNVISSLPYCAASCMHLEGSSNRGHVPCTFWRLLSVSQPAAAPKQTPAPSPVVFDASPSGHWGCDLNTAFELLPGRESWHAHPGRDPHRSALAFSIMTCSLSVVITDCLTLTDHLSAAGPLIYVFHPNPGLGAVVVQHTCLRPRSPVPANVL